MVVKHAIVYRLAVITAVLLTAACASVPLADKESDAAGKRFDPPPSGLAKLYVYQSACSPSSVRPMGTVYVVDQGSCGTNSVYLRMDSQQDRNVGQLGPGNWLSIDVTPGDYDIWCEQGATSARTQKLELKSGEQAFVALVRLKEDDFLGFKGYGCIPRKVGPQAGMVAVKERQRARTP